MTSLVTTRSMAVSHDRVWAAIADLGSHHLWMRDAESVEFVGDRRSGEGTRLDVSTVVGPFRTLDRLEVTGWVEGHSIEVSHQGLVKGRGKLTVESAGEGSIVTWREELSFPWWLGGPITALFARPVLGAIWRGNLRRLEDWVSPGSTGL